MTEELIKRLRKWAKSDLGLIVMYEAADTIETQAAEIKRLREALEGIANHPLANKPSDLAGWREFSKMLRRIARAALGETE